MDFKIGTNIRKCLVWSLNATTSEHVHGSTLTSHLLSCTSDITISRLWFPILKYIGLYPPQKPWFNYVTHCIMIRLLPPKEHSVLSLENCVEAMWKRCTLPVCHTLQISILNFRSSYVKVRSIVPHGSNYAYMHIRILLKQNATTANCF